VAGERAGTPKRQERAKGSPDQEIHCSKSYFNLPSVGSSPILPLLENAPNLGYFCIDGQPPEGLTRSDARGFGSMLG
jgi:hypothetical protein